MTLPWSKLPRYLAGDPRLTLLSPEATCAYLAARLLADDYGSLWCVGDRDAVGTLAAVIASKRTADAGWARRAVEECVDAGLLDLCDDGAAMRVVDWIADGAAPVIAATSASSADPGQPARGRGRGRPTKGAAPMSARERRVRSAFRNREWKEFRDVPAGMTWEQWAAEHPATRTKLLRPANENPATRTKIANENTDDANENPPSGRAGSEPSELSETQRDGEHREKSESSDAAARERKSRTKIAVDANENPQARTKIPTASCHDVEPATPFAADEVLSRMSAASGQRIAALGSSTHMEAFAVVARDLMARGGVTVPALVRAGAHAAHTPWIQRMKSPLTVERLSAAGGKTLVELLTAAASCPRCGGVEIPAGPADPAEDPDEAAFTAARARYLTADLNRPPLAPGAHAS